MLALMASKGRMGLLGEVARAVHRQLEQRAGRIEVTVTTALALDADRQQAITQMLQEALSAPPAVTWQVDPDLLGGLRVQVDDAVYDASLAGRLGQLVDRMSHRRTQERPQP
jgi:F-type H+-transporting ATPase subunit delta